jgi:5-methyltetrahydropteroyltriglutamate--homocysteine methyltransferase
MRRSETRILTTHAGSLPRPKGLIELFTRASRGEPIDTAALAEQVRAATAHVVAWQLACGIDVGNDGEQPRESFFTYVRDRMSGFGGQSQRPVMRDLTRYPTFIERMMLELGRPQVSLLSAPQAVGAVRYVDPAPLAREMDAFAATLATHTPTFTETFWTAPSPGIVACAMQNAHYPSLEAYVDAVADALATEYAAIVARGHVLQIDAPDLAMERHTSFADRPLDDFLRFVEHTVGAMNRALARIPPHRVRLHVCWGNYEGPHTDDVELAPLLPLVYQARVGGLVLSMANPRHAHEHRVLTAHPLPDDWVLVAGVIDTTTNYVEHPEVVAERLEIAARVTRDPHRVLAGTDCGFDTAAGLGQVAEEVVWEKLRALRDGAALATARLLPP